MEQTTPADEEDRGAAEARPLQRDDSDRQRRVDERAERVEQPEKGGAPAGPLRQQIPGGVRDGGGEDERDGKGGNG